MANPWKQVVFDLKLQSAKEPSDYSTATGEVDGGLRLMDSPDVVDLPAAGPGKWKFRFLNTVRQLKDDAHYDAQYECSHGVAGQNYPQAMEERGNGERQGEEGRFAGHEGHQIPSFRTRNPMLTNPSFDDILEIVKQLPLDCRQSVEWPEIKVLPPVEWETPLMRRQPTEDAEINIRVMASSEGSPILCPKNGVHFTLFFSH